MVGLPYAGNLESDLQAGAQTGYTIMWVLLWSTIMVRMLIMQANVPLYSIGFCCFAMDAHMSCP